MFRGYGLRKRIKRDMYGIPVNYNDEYDDENGAAANISSRSLRLKKRLEKRKEVELDKDDSNAEEMEIAEDKSLKEDEEEADEEVKEE